VEEGSHFFRVALQGHHDQPRWWRSPAAYIRPGRRPLALEPSVLPAAGAVLDGLTASGLLLVNE
jgi:hypothetical protein